jgi:hypothetical protein
LYSNSTLVYWRARYSENILWNFRNAIWRELSPEEKQRLQSVDIAFPLTSPRGDPLDYYTLLSSTAAQINLPVLSIKFFDDLAIAYAWLGENGYDTQTATDYVALLKYLYPADFPGGRYEAPLRALQIPADALSDPVVNNLAQKILKSAIIWILLHELGHAFYRHGKPTDIQTAQHQEMQADNFATEIMRRIGVAPVGMGFFFATAVLWWPNRSDCPSSAAWQQALRNSQHPATTDRLRRLAALIRQYRRDFVRKEPNPSAALLAVNSATNTLDQMANFLASEDLQRTIRRMAQLFGALPDPLAPRRPGHMPASPSTSSVRIPDTRTSICLP